MVRPVQIIVFQKLRSFFTFSGPTLSYNYRIIVHLATLALCNYDVIHVAVLPDFQRGIIVQKVKNYRFLTKMVVFRSFYAIFRKFYKINMAKKMVCPVRIIVFQK